MALYGYRRGSILWALLLIAVGFIFLYQNFNPAVHPWHIIAKFWPLLIIFWGISKLIEHLEARHHPETAAPPLFSGSEIVLLLLILVLGTLVSRIVLRPWGHWASDMGINMGEGEWANPFLSSFTYTQTLSQHVNPQPHLVFVDRRGDVEVHGRDQATVDAILKETIRTPSEEDAKKLSGQIKFEIVEHAGGYLLKTNLESLPNAGRNIRLDLTLRVPLSTSVEITSEHGDLTLEGLKGDQSAGSNHGDLRISNVEGLVRAHKSGGSTEIRNVRGSAELDGRGTDVRITDLTGAAAINGEFSGDVQCRNIGQTLHYASARTELTAQKLSGRLNMAMGSLEASGIDGPFQISTRAKDINLDGFKHSVKITNTNGDIQLRAFAAPAHLIEVDSKKGEIELALPADSSFQIEAKSQHGEVESDFAAPTLAVSKEGDAPSITGSYGKGGPAIRLFTAFGTIHLIRQGAHPAPPARHSPGDSEAMNRAGRRQLALQVHSAD